MLSSVAVAGPVAVPAPPPPAPQAPAQEPSSTHGASQRTITERPSESTDEAANVIAAESDSSESVDDAADSAASDAVGEKRAAESASPADSKKARILFRHEDIVLSTFLPSPHTYMLYGKGTQDTWIGGAELNHKYVCEGFLADVSQFLRGGEAGGISASRQNRQPTGDLRHVQKSQRGMAQTGTRVDCNAGMQADLNI